MYIIITKSSSPYGKILEPLIMPYQYLQYVPMQCISFYNMQQLTYSSVPFYLSYAIMYHKRAEVKCHAVSALPKVSCAHICVFNLSEEIQNHSDSWL